MQQSKPLAYWQQTASEDLENIIVFIAQDNPLAAFELEELAYQTADHYELINDGISILAVVHTRMNFPKTYRQ